MSVGGHSPEGMANPAGAVAEHHMAEGDEKRGPQAEVWTEHQTEGATPQPC